jgi:hypothetical protein
MTLRGKLERKLGGKEFRGGSAALFILGTDSAAATNSRIYPTNTVA